MDILISTHELGRNETTGFVPLIGSEAATRGHAVRAVQSLPTETPDSIPVTVLDVPQVQSPWWVRSWLFYRAWRRQFKTELSRQTPDVIVAATRTLIPTVQVAREHRVPVVGIYIGLGTFGYANSSLGPNKTPQFSSLDWSARFQYPFVRRLYCQQRNAIRDFSEVVVVSEFLQKCLSETFGIDSTVIRTPVPVKAVRASERIPEAITMVNPRTRLKGGSIFLNIAAALPDHQFVIAGSFADESTAERARALDNVEPLGWVDDMRDVYRRTGLLLVPSLVEEGGPRVIGEAFANAIPVVGTDRGAIPEFVGDAGEIVTDPQDTVMWVDRIEKVLGDSGRYERRARERVELFDFSSRADRIFDLFKRASRSD